MGLFYAYLRVDHGDRPRYLLTFASREAADEWWRMIVSGSPYAQMMIRVNPQFYTYNDASSPFARRLLQRPELPEAYQYHGEMFMTPMRNQTDDSLPFVIPSVALTDHISGRWYFVRSKTDTRSYWYVGIRAVCACCGNKECAALHVSNQYRTRFCVRARTAADESEEQGNWVMIGKDEIAIGIHGDHTLHINDDADLQVTKGYQGETDLRFDDLKNRFIVQERERPVQRYVVAVERGTGEAWELVE